VGASDVAGFEAEDIPGGEEYLRRRIFGVESNTTPDVMLTGVSEALVYFDDEE